jgi:hypothetical protein
MGAILRNGHWPLAIGHWFRTRLRSAAFLSSGLLSLQAATAKAQAEATEVPDQATGAVEMPDPGPQPPYPQAHLWRPLALDQWQVEVVVDGRMSLDTGAVAHPSDVIFGASLGVIDQLQATVNLDLRATRTPEAANPEVAYALEVGGAYAVFTSGTGALSAAGGLSIWIPLQGSDSLPATSMLQGVWRGIAPQAPPYPTLVTTLQAVWRIVSAFGLRMVLALPVTLKDNPAEILSFVVRPEVQPLDWLWLNVGAGIALAGSDDLLAPLDFELGFTPWRYFDVFASLVFPDLQESGVDVRTLTVGLRVRPQDR